DAATDSAATETEAAQDEDSPEEERSSRSRRSRSRSRRSSQRDEGAGEERHEGSAEEDEEESADEDGSEDHSSSGSSSNGSSRRRRRRGGRGRRGRGRGEDDGDEGTDGADDTDGAQDGSGDSAQDDAEGDSAASGPESGGDSSSGSSSSRRRRRRRRSGGGNDDSGSTDDPPNTVVKVREARDEVKAVKGSTRLEAKRQRRREGRDAGRRRSVITEAEFLARRESVKRSMVVRERPGRTQIAVLEDDVLVEHYVAQKSQTSMVGNVYMGKVQNVLPSMEAAFVDIGKGRNAVLYAGEVNWDAAGLEGQPRRIELALKSGDPVLVQVTKDPIGHKGARLTSQVSLPGRYVVFVPGGSMTGISRKLPDTERSRLKKIMRQIIPEDAGVIVRTASEGASEEELTHDVERLRAQWDKIQKAQKSKTAPVALSQEPDIAIKVVRDVFNEDFTSLIVEGGKVYDDVHAYVSEVAPDLLERVTKHVGEKDVFAKHRIDEQLLKAMDRKVYLPSGGSLVIDRTEAMTVVDVNTGKFTGSGGSLEETVTKNNIESAEEIVRQLRLRDIGGIIVIDFIDMVLESNRDLVLRRLVECLGRDRTKHQVAEVTSLGLVQMTRKRVGQGLVETFSTTCEHCHGRGLIVDADGEHHHGNGNGNGNGNGGEDSSKSSRRRGRRPRSGAKDEGTEHGGEETGGDVHRLEDDESSRAQARATIASIAAASGSASQPEGSEDPAEGAEDAAATAWEQDAPEQG
ncbi:MAG: Rne/Rng family ribonuclease, partial [Brachybacterium sp.]|nr:Rne/Rng family ribonuclease [Brachybacterium sp.]